MVVNGRQRSTTVDNGRQRSTMVVNGRQRSTTVDNGGHFFLFFASLAVRALYAIIILHSNLLFIHYLPLFYYPLTL